MLPPAEQEALFRKRGVERGYVYRNIPKAYGGSEQPPDVLVETILAEEYRNAGAPGGIHQPGPVMLAPTLVECGSDEQCRRFIPPTLHGEIVWCQGYSEPGAGSDLASLQSRAELDGDQWVINGHKIWTSKAHKANYMFGLFRTEPGASKHGGISYLLVDMKSPGIEIRPLRMMTGGADFNEVTLKDVRTPADHIVGKRGEGWAVSKVTLKYERSMMGDPRMMRRFFDGLVALAKTRIRNGRPAIEDSGVRQLLSEIEGFVRCQEYGTYRMLTATARGEEMKAMLPMMMIKLYSTDTEQLITRAAHDLLGIEGLLAPNEVEAAHGTLPAHTTGRWNAEYMFAVAHAIAGGASNIQRNIIGERALGLPRDLRRSK